MKFTSCPSETFEGKTEAFSKKRLIFFPQNISKTSGVFPCKRKEPCNDAVDNLIMTSTSAG